MKKLALFLLPLAFCSTVFAGTDTISVQKCNIQDKITTGEVKYIGNDLFLDSYGNQVNPCTKEDDLVYFRIVDHYKDGQKIFKKSKQPVLNKSGFEDIIQINFARDYSITYGNNNLNIEDIDSFLRKSKQQDYDEKIGKALSTRTITDLSYDKIKKELKIPENLTVSQKYTNAIREEKDRDIETKYKAFLNNSNAIIKQEEDTISKRFISTAVKRNRQMIFDNKIVKQFPEFTIDEEGRLKGEPNGIAFKLYEVVQTGLNFQNEAQAYVRDVVADTRTSRDDKLALLEYLEKANLYSLGEDLYDEALSKWERDLINPTKFELEGQNDIKSANIETLEKFLDNIKSANKEIKSLEFDELPNKIDKKQYNSLSDIDKYKYIPVRNSDGFINKNLYQKANNCDSLVE